jgi:hypothetical protein
MAGKHRKIGARARRVAMLSAATATASAMTVSIAAPPATVRSEVVQTPVDLAAAIRLLPNHDQVPDLTGGLGSQIYGGGQALTDQISRAVINGINLTGLAQAVGIDPKHLLQTLLADLPANLLPGILAALSLKIPILGPALGTLTGGDVKLLTGILNLLGITEITNGTLTGLLALLGLNLADPLNLSGLAVPGLNVVTTGDIFTGLKLLGLDLGWLPATPNGVANEINNTPYLKLGVDGVLDIVLDKLQRLPADPIVGSLISQLAALIGRITDPLTSNLPDVIDLRVIPTVGSGLGAFAAAMAYQQVLDQLKYQPGGSAYDPLKPLLGSLTILPLILINNPARPDGGAFARFGALASLFGINTVNPTTQVTSDGTGVPVLGTGIKLGAANVLPIMIDATYEYQPLSDLASWPNPFTLANNLAAGLLPTYMLRGLSLDGLGDQILGQVGGLVQDAVDQNKPLSLNVYLTLHSATSPMLEPLYLASDFLNIVGLSPLAAIPMKLANALAPALNTLINIGYANVVQNPDGTYTRDFTNAGTETPFFSFANIDYGRVLGDVVNQLVGGFSKEFFSANPTPGTPNVLSNLLNALLSGGIGDILGGAPAAGGSGATNPLGGLLGGLGGLLGGILGGLGIGAAAAPLATANQTASSIPEANATFSRLSISGGATDETATPAADSEKTPATTDATAETVKDPTATTDTTVKDPTATTDSTVKDPTATTETTAKDPTVVEKPATETDTAATDPVTKPVEKPATSDSGTGTATGTDAGTDDTTGPKHAKPDTGAPPAAKDSTPKHAKADEDGKPGADTTDKTPKKDKPSLNVVRNSPNASTDAKTGASESGKKKDEGAKKDEPAGAAAPSAGASSDSSAAGSSSNAA